MFLIPISIKGADLSKKSLLLSKYKMMVWKRKMDKIMVVARLTYEGKVKDILVSSKVELWPSLCATMD